MAETAGTTVDWDRYRAEFPIRERYVYFNHAAVSPVSTRVRDAIDSVSEHLLRKGMLSENEVFGHAGKVRGLAAELIGASADEIAFTRNTTNGVLIAAHGIRWREGDNVVMPSIEFPANVYPWMALAPRGVRIKAVPPNDGKVTAAMLADACDERTRAVSVSFVQFSNGYRIELEELGSFCRKRGIYLHVDGIQALGMLACDVERFKIDFLSAGGHKWLLAVPGIGILYCRKELFDEIDIWNPGWTGVVDPHNFLAYDPTYRNEAARFEEGSPNFHGIFGLGAAIERFLEIGMDRVEERILHITGLLEKGLRERGCTITSPRDKLSRSGILCFVKPGIDPEKLYGTLTTHGVVTSLRGGAIRLSPHFYNSEGDIERFFKVIQ